MDKELLKLILDLRTVGQWLVEDIEDMLEDYNYEGEITKTHINRLKRRIETFKRFDNSLIDSLNK